ncbi:hypothetical protein LXD69_02085 [Flavobacterium sediminilitoris]|uniref:VWFA domain-containing protein n=1 Tax=Flavobacterium sediminilitoris TaxID=2024526 RepID=A0ABY4HN85_9FLAO|nr:MULTISPECIES: hypothetical protein [Flavobacterium]UOX34317.1 hypothetical protein LXD69_02085 [Flavobacterium sediminilitoris]
MKSILKPIFIIITFLFIASCKTDDKSENTISIEGNAKLTNETENKNYNISILIDLSDRIDTIKHSNPTMEYYNRDLGYIKSVSEAFSSHVRNKRVNIMNDNIQVFFNPNPLNAEINEISKKLKIRVNKNNVSKEFINTINSIYVSETSKIYSLALNDSKYIGSDIWNFFQNNINDYCIEGSHRNILVILTDGYIYYKDSNFKEDNQSTYLTPELIRTYSLNNKNWKESMEAKKIGYLKANDDLSNLEILVLGINPSIKNPYEGKVIKEFWSNWFKEMKVKRFEIKETALPSNMDKVIKDFIEKV